MKLPYPYPNSETTTKVMKSNKGKNTKPEVIVRTALRKAGYPGYRLHWKKILGHPDIVYPGRKIAIFVNGCFWHRCPYCNLPMPKRNQEYWIPKFERNIERDREEYAKLEEQGWQVFVIWECQLNKKNSDPLKDIINALNQTDSKRRK